MVQILIPFYFAFILCPQNPTTSKSLPEQWKERQQLETEAAFIYSSDPFAAKEEQYRLSSLVDLLRENSISPHGKGILILSCPKDSLPTEEMKKLINKFTFHGDEEKKEMMSLGISPEESLKLFLLNSYDSEDKLLMEELGFDRQAVKNVPWIVAIPSPDLIRELIGKLVAAGSRFVSEGMKKKMGEQPTNQAEERKLKLAQLAMGVLKGWEWKSKKEADRDITLFRALIQTDSDLSVSEKRELTGSFSKWRRSGLGWLRGEWARSQH